jgi:probable phosphoglycerate mutase
LFEPDGPIPPDVSVIELTLIRHGETIYNSEVRIQGTMDSPLTERGRRETIQLAKSLRQWLEPVDAWFVSPLGRARETSELLRAGLPDDLPIPIIDERLREIDCGSYEGKQEAELDPEIRKRMVVDPTCPYPGGECIIDVMRRGEEFLGSLLRSAEGFPDRYHAVIVAHGNFNRSFGSVLTGLGPYFALRVQQHNTAVNRLFSRNGEAIFRIRVWNDTSHLLNGGED